MVDCLQFYLTTIGQSIKINPPMKNIQQRIYNAQMGSQFNDWALIYFSQDGGNINTMRSKEDAMKDFINSSNVKNWSTQKFTKSLKAFCRKYGYTLNPKDYQNGQGRIIRKLYDKATEMIYVQTTEEIDQSELSSQTPF